MFHWLRSLVTLHWVRVLVRELWRDWKYYQHDLYVPLRAEWFDENKHGFDRPL